MQINEVFEATNIAENLDKKKLLEIGTDASEGFEADLKSREELEELLDRWTRLALQVTEKKTFPWANAANVKYPLLATASMQFAARAYPTLVPSNGKVVKCKTIGSDPTGQKTQIASQVSQYMSYQIMDEMEEWEEEMDKLLITLPITGTVFKKTYWDSIKQRNISCVVMPKNLVVNYWAKNLEECERISEVIPMSQRKLREKQLNGLFLDIELDEPMTSDHKVDKIKTYGQTAPESDDTTPYNIIEQHKFLDLDEDGYSEPYVVTFEEKSKKVLRIAPRFTQEMVTTDPEDEGKIVKIDAIQYYTKYEFVPNPDGSFYGIGFGRLLGPLNDAVDTLTNQLIDAGTLSNLQAGFIGKGLRIKMGDSRFAPGEWKVVNATGQDIKQQIFALPTRDPSPVLMQLLQFLIQSGKELASVAEIFVGKMPGQNTPATTTMASIEQGMKVFTAVYKRIYRSLTKEFRKLYVLNGIYLNPETETDVLDVPVQQSIFQGNPNDVIPAADPAAVSGQEKQAKVQALMQIMQMGTLNPMAVTELYLDAFEIPQPEKYIAQPQPQQGPSPEQQQMETEMQMKAQEQQMKMSAEERKMQLKAAESQQKAQLEREASLQKIKDMAIMGEIKRRDAMANAQTSQQVAQATHTQKLVHSQQQHEAKLKQQGTTKKQPTKK